MTSTEPQKSTETRIRVKFYTQQEKYRVPSDPIFLPINLKRLGLSTVINHLLSHETPVPFEFLINGQILKGSIDNYLKSNNLSTENVLELEYLESVLPPTPQAQFQHDDWISTIDKTTDKLIATGSYDNIIRLWNKSGEVVDSLSCHTGPIKDINWIDNDNNVAFLSASLDQTIVAWKKNDSDSYEPLYTAIGHTKSVESVKVSPNLVHFATSSLDGTIKLWNLASLEEDEHHVANRPSTTIKPSAKKTKVRHELCKTSIMTLSEHRGPVSSIQFHNTSASVLYSGGWDHSLRTWDLTTETNLNTKNCEKPFNSLHINASNSLLASGHTDRLIRLWDARVNDNTVMKLGLVGHSNWVSQVFWNEQNDSQLISSSYDGTIRGWDIRSKTPIFTLNHNAENPESKVLCVNWFDNLIVSGGDDQVLGIHKVNDKN